LIKRKLDKFEQELISKDIEKLREEKPEWFPFYEEVDEENNDRLADANQVMVWSAKSLAWEVKQFGEKIYYGKHLVGGSNGIMKQSPTDKAPLFEYDPLCKKQASLFYASTKNYTYSNRCLLEYDDYLQEARYKICALAAAGKHTNTYEKAVINHLKDYRRNAKKRIVDFEDKKEEEKDE